MKRIIIAIMLSLLLLPIALSQVEIQYSTDNSTWVNITNINEEINEAYQINLQGGTEYFFRARNDSSQYQYLSQRTKPGPEDVMASLAITIFVLSIAGTLLYLALKVNFTSNDFTNLIFRRAFIVLFSYFMMMNSAIMATIADHAGITLTQEMFRYMWFFGVAGYVLAGYMVLKTLFDLVGRYKVKQENKRMGNQ